MRIIRGFGSAETVAYDLNYQGEPPAACLMLDVRRFTFEFARSVITFVIVTNFLISMKL